MEISRLRIGLALTVPGGGNESTACPRARWLAAEGVHHLERDESDGSSSLLIQGDELCQGL
jgi:hypothetical protein